ncbi:MAG: diguanylate cyclase [Rhodobacteraceae bacterium]|nr:diguanylate cyclase [Paracoccaceae bacterium]
MTMPQTVPAPVGALLDQAGLDTMMPLHILVGPDGRITQAGPTMQKLLKGGVLAGRKLDKILSVRRPGVPLAEVLRKQAATPVHVALRTTPETALKGLAVALPDGQGMLLNLSPGIAIADLVADFALNSGDFAASDLAVELLYLIEAQSAVLAESKRLNTRLLSARISAEEQAFSDTLTGVRNRRALDHVLARLTTDRRRRDFGLMHVDLDYFKSVNDTHGHAAGDFVLQRAAEILVAETRSEDIVARTGGDEFVLVVTECNDARLMSRIGRRIIHRLEQPIHFEGRVCRISASIGYTMSGNYRELDPVKLAADADAALYRSKHRGRACCTMSRAAANNG